MKPDLEKIVDRVDKTAGPKASVLLQDTCDKRIYRRGDYRIVIYTLPQTLNTTRSGLSVTQYERIRGFAGQDRGDLGADQAKACVDRALADLQTIGVGSDAMALYRQRYAMQWDDPDVGPARYLNCTGKGISYQRSLSVMIHEATHELTKGNCLYSLHSGYTVCFSLPVTLPSASIAASEIHNPVGQRSKYVEQMENAQTLYLSDLSSRNRGPGFLFNELNAYTAGTEVLSALLRTDGTEGLLEGGKPVPVLLPLVSLWTVRYLNAMKKLDPDFYSEILAPGNADREQVDALLAHAEEAWQNWIAAEKQKHLTPLPDEEEIWKEYLAEKTSGAQASESASE